MSNPNILYIDSTLSGLSGDMLISGFVDLGLPIKKISEVTAVLEKRYPYEKITRFQFKTMTKHNFKAKYLSLEIKGENTALPVSELKTILNNCLDDLQISGKYHTYAEKVLDTLITSEAHAHSSNLDELHFHELSSIDTLLDILSVTRALEYYSALDEMEIYASPIPVGGGVIEFSHGKSTVPAPAVLEILKKYNAPFRYGPVNEELLTPTGAALLVNLNPKFTTIPYTITVSKVGKGAGSKQINGFPNILRLILAEKYGTLPSNNLNPEKIVVLETNLDDITGEFLGYTIDKLIQLDAKDVSVISTITKKNRPGYILKVVCNQETEPTLVDAIFNLTGTLGIRRLLQDRYTLKRKIETVKITISDSTYNVRVKISETPKGERRYKPEFDDVIHISEETQLPPSKINEIIRKKLS
ncbi:MAG: nickel pincer cofactor biosynthesis protein LarC [Candidatus Odinarchaeia archaeon]